MKKKYKNYRREEKVLIIKLSILAVVTLATTFLLLSGSQKNQKGQQGKERQQEPEKIVVKTKKSCNTGNIVIYADGGVYKYRGKVDIENDGKNGQDVSVILEGYIQENFSHGTPEIAEKEGE